MSNTEVNLQAELLNALKKEDDLGMVLRAHAVVEHWVIQLIETLVPHPKYIKAMGLDHAARVNLAVALGLNSKFSRPLLALGKVRNNFAHDLKEASWKQDSNNLYKSLSENEKKMFQSEYKKLTDQSDLEVPPISQISPRDKFIYMVVILSAGLEVACREVKKRNIGLYAALEN